MYLRGFGILGLISGNLMKRMYGNKYDVIVLICELHHLMHTSLVVLHPHKSAEYSHTIVDMDYIIPYRKRCKVIDGKLLALVDRPPYAHTMESVEYFMVTVAAYLVFMIYESVVYVAAGNEFRYHSPVLRKYGSQSFQLGLLLPVYPHPVSFLHALAYILGKELEILVEYRLGSYAEPDGILILTGKRNLHINLTEPVRNRPETPVIIHIGRIKPEKRIFRKDIHYADLLGLIIFGSDYIRVYFRLDHLLLGKLCVAVKYVYGIYLISEKRYSERIVI